MAVSVKGEKIDISIVIPIMNEAQNILPLANEIKSVMEAEFQGWECIWVDDGSTDGSLAALGELACADGRHRFISFERNTGQSAALWAGFSQSRAPIIATIDGDGQNDPADIPALFRTVVSGDADMANGYRANRQDNFKRKISSILGNGFRTMADRQNRKRRGMLNQGLPQGMPGIVPSIHRNAPFAPHTGSNARVQTDRGPR